MLQSSMYSIQVSNAFVKRKTALPEKKGERSNERVLVDKKLSQYQYSIFCKASSSLAVEHFVHIESAFEEAVPGIENIRPHLNIIER